MAQINLGKQIRSDFTPRLYDKKIEEKGYRALWSRAVLCPCRFSVQTKHPDPSCGVCYGDGWFYTCPSVDTVKTLDDIGFVATDAAAATKVIMTSHEKSPQVFEHMGDWIIGMARVTSFSFHRVAYRDRLTFVDAVSQWQQVMKVPTSLTISVRPRGEESEYLRYPVVEMIGVYALDATTGAATDHTAAVTCNADGSLTLSTTTGLAAGQLITVVYGYRPTLVIVQNTLDIRMSSFTFKSASEVQDYKPRSMLAKPDFFPEESVGLPTDTPSD